MSSMKNNLTLFFEFDFILLSCVHKGEVEYTVQKIGSYFDFSYDDFAMISYLPASTMAMGSLQMPIYRWMNKILV